MSVRLLVQTGGCGIQGLWSIEWTLQRHRDCHVPVLFLQKINIDGRKNKRVSSICDELHNLNAILETISDI